MNEPEVIPLADLARVPAERAASAVPWGGTAVWTAAEILHWAAWPGMTPEASMAAVAAVGVAFGAAAHRGWGWKVPVLTAAFTAWFVFACARGPLDGFPVPPLTIMWAILTGITWRLASRHPSILEAIAWRAARAEWLAVRHRWHLGGSHLLEHEETRLGERFVIDVREAGRLASGIARDSALPERIAMDRGIPRSRVTVAEGTPAGRVIIDIRDRDPWEHPIAHPAVTPGHEIGLDPSPSITGPAAIGQDPATGRLLSLLLCGPGGGLNLNIVATIDSGKTVLLSCISEFVTRAPDALMIRINVSIKGPAEEHLWGPACHLTAFGPHQRARALKVLKVVAGIVEWRASQPKTRANWLPSPRDPHIVLLIDEIDSLTEVPGARKALEVINTKGREFGVTTGRAGQRGTAEDTGGAKVRAVDGLWCLGSLNRSTEAMHAAGDLGLRLPDVASYGEGNPGVWIIADKSGRWQGGRAWNLCEPADIAGIAAERAHLQPDLPPACKEFLGDEYAILLGTDVYARWARDRAGDDADRDFMASRPRSAPLNPAGTAVAAPATLTDEDLTERLDWDMDEGMKAKFAAIDAKLDAARQALAETEAMDKGPDVPQEKLRESSEARWAMLAEDTVIPPETRERLLDLLSGDGMSGRKITEALTAENPGNPLKRAWVMGWLNRLRWEKAAYVDGKGAGARWRLTAERGDGS